MNAEIIGPNTVSVDGLLVPAIEPEAWEDDDRGLVVAFGYPTESPVGLNAYVYVRDGEAKVSVTAPETAGNPAGDCVVVPGSDDLLHVVPLYNEDARERMVMAIFGRPWAWEGTDATLLLSVLRQLAEATLLPVAAETPAAVRMLSEMAWTP